VNNESSEVIRMFYTEFDALIPEPMREATKGSAGLYPPHLQSQIEEMNAWVYPELNNGVYRTGFATSQDAYDAAVATVFVALDKLEHHLAKSNTPYLFGDNITEADIRLYPTILRFDVAYHTIFKCNLKMIRYDYPKLHAWVRNLYWDESERTRGAFKNTVDFQAVSIVVDP
jgi:putative glutathione S-transferase